MKYPKTLPICAIITLILSTPVQSLALTSDKQSAESLVASASITQATPIEQFNYSVNSTTGEVTITKYKGIDKDVVIPETIDAHPVTTIGDGAFLNKTQLKSIDLQQVTTIGISAFSGCTSLETVNSQNLKTVSERGFVQNLKLTSIDLQQVTTVGEFAFQGCASLKAVNSQNLETIGEYSFSLCTSLKSIDLSKVSIIPKYAFMFSQSLNNIDTSNVTIISQGGFMGCTSLTNLDLPKIETLGYDVFAECNSLESITISKDVKSIGVYPYSNPKEPRLFANSNPKNLTIDYGTSDISKLTIADWNNFITKFPALNRSWTGKYLKNNSKTMDLAETQAPVITLNGDNPLTVYFGSTFTEPGATITDNNVNQAPIEYQVSGEVNTNVPGQYILTYSAQDAAGNKATNQRIINVIYDYKGLLQPVNTDGSSIFKGGSTIPVKFQLRDANGNYISTAIAKLSYAKVSNTSIGSVNEAVSTSAATTKNLFRYDINSTLLYKKI